MTLDVRGLHAGYGAVEVLHGVDMAFPGGCVVAVVGSNSAGKTTLLRCVAGLMAVQRGSIAWDGIDLTNSSTVERARLGMVLVPDERNVFTSLTVRENLDLLTGGADPAGALDAFPSMRALLDRRAGTLSGGERQMVALTPAIVRRSRLVLLDEPSRALSPAAIDAFYAAVVATQTAERTVVIVEQHLGRVTRVADIVYRLQRGRVVFAGEPGELAPAFVGEAG